MSMSPRAMQDAQALDIVEAARDRVLAGNPSTSDKLLTIIAARLRVQANRILSADPINRAELSNTDALVLARDAIVELLNWSDGMAPHGLEPDVKRVLEALRLPD